MATDRSRPPQVSPWPRKKAPPWIHTSTGNGFRRAAPPVPILAGISASDDVDLTLDTLFEFGLQRMLDGIALLVM